MDLLNLEPPFRNPGYAPEYIHCKLTLPTLILQKYESQLSPYWYLHMTHDDQQKLEANSKLHELLRQ